jgi:hypothetical protein
VNFFFFNGKIKVSFGRWILPKRAVWGKREEVVTSLIYQQQSTKSGLNFKH